jgi:nucleoid-associated protein YgaU
MSKFLAGFGGGTGVAATAAVGAVAIAGVVWTQFEDKEQPAVVPVVATAPVADAKIETKPEVVVPQVDPAVETVEKAPDPVPPAFDEVRREADGMTVIAGRAAAGALVKILRDGVEIATATADSSGKFATIMMIAPDGAAHVLSLVQTLGTETLASLDEIILAPLAAPVVIAQVTDPEPETPVTPVVAQREPEVKNASDVEAEVAAVDPLVETAQSDAVAANVEKVDEKVAEEPTITATAKENLPEPTAPAAEVVDQTVTKAEAVTSKPEIANVEVAKAETPVPSVTAKTIGDQAVTKAGTALPADNTEVAKATPEVGQQQAGVVQQTTSLSEPAQDTAVVPKSLPAAPAQTDVAVLKSTAEGVELLNPAAPEVMDNVALDTISYSQGGDVQLSGRAQSDTRAVRVYLNNNAIASLDVGADGQWKGDLPNVDEGIYTLRVDEVASDGSVTSRVETPFKREDPAVLAAASAAQTGPIKAITVQKGATLWAIARDRYGSGELYVRVFEANREAIRNADLIYPGQVFDLPD